MKIVFCSLIAFLFTLSVFAQRITYKFAAPNAVHHEAEITVLAEGLPGTPALFKMSRSSPGRYAKHEFGKNVYNVMAFNEAGKALKLEKEDADVYKVSGHKGTIRLTYTLYGNYADGTYASIDISGYHLNMPAAFMWVKGMEKAPITLQFTLPVASWTIATQLKPTSDSLTFTAPDLQYFMDSPTKVGNLHIREWTVTNADNKPYTFRLALEAEAPETLVDQFTEMLKRVVQAGKGVYGELPAFDYGTYTFIASINPYVRNDGMEHRNSTMITRGDHFDGKPGELNVFAHEFFHSWNVERIRPKGLEPFNFEKSNMSDALWLAEGFTQYYGNVLMLRAGLTTKEDFLNNMSGLVNAKVNTPGAQLYSPIENSQRAVFVDAGVSIDATNYANMFTSYYTYGAAIALALDLELRSRFNKTLDDFMKVLWQKYGKPFIPYTVPDLQSTLAVTTGNSMYAEDFFKRYIYGHEQIDYNKLFATVGYTTTPAAKDKAGIGRVRLDSTISGIAITSNTIRNTPLYEAGVDINDIIVEMDGKKITASKDIQNILVQHKPAESIPLAYLHRNNLIRTTLTLKEDAAIRLQPLETSATEKQLKLQSAWLKQND
jgi:predicted metalloprotease with PDZ domain